MSTVPTNPPANPLPGAIYVDRATNIGYVYTGSGWIPASGGSTSYRAQITTGSTILPGFYAEPSPESFITQTGAQPVNPGDGQIWVDTTTTPSPAYVWYNDSWFKITDGEFTNTTVAAMYTGTPDEGDTFYETTTGRFYVRYGNQWMVVGESDDTHTIYASGAPIKRANGDDLQVGDLWINPNTGYLSYHIGGSVWDLVKATSAGSLAVYSSAPTVGPIGDVYYNTTDFTTYTSDGSAWVPIAGSLTSASSFAVYSSAPTVGPIGDVYYNTTDFTTYTSDGSAWIPITGSPINNDTHSFTGTSAPTLIARPNGTALQDGDTYIDDSNNSAYYYDLSENAWKPISATAAQATRTSVGTLFGYTSDSLSGGPGGERDNVFLGYGESLQPTFSGNYNVSIGPYSGLHKATTANANIFIGQSAGYEAITAADNVIIGENSGASIEDSSGAVVVGHDAATNTATLPNVTAIGNNALSDNIFDDFLANTAIGAYAGCGSQGAYNIHVGYRSGAYATSNNSVFIGTCLPDPVSAATIPDGTFILARPQATDNTIFRINENNAFGIPTSNGSTTVDYGTTGQVLSSQGTGAPPQWITVSGVGASPADVTVRGTVYAHTDGTETLTALGYNTGDTTDNRYGSVFVGYESGSGSINSRSNSFVGFKSGQNWDGTQNTFIGFEAGVAHPTPSTSVGSYNVFIGVAAGSQSAGKNNCYVGAYSGRLADGDGNIFLGCWNKRAIGNGNVVIGSYGYDRVSDDTLLISYGADLSSATTPATKVFVQGNSQGAWGLWDGGDLSIGSANVDYGTSGQVLTSQGSAAPPQWTTVSGGTNADSAFMVGSSAPLNRGDGSAIQLNDIWFDNDNAPDSPAMYIYDGGSWISAMNTVTGGTQNVFSITQRSSGGNLVENDLYYDFANYKIYTRHSNVWTEIGSRAPSSQLTVGTFTNVQFVSFLNPINVLDPADTAITVNTPGSDVQNGAQLKLVASQAGTPIVLTSANNFNGISNTYSWTPTAIGQVLTLTYFPTTLSTYGYLLELSYA